MVGTTKLVERNRKEMIDVSPVVRAQRENLLKTIGWYCVLYVNFTSGSAKMVGTTKLVERNRTEMIIV